MMMMIAETNYRAVRYTLELKTGLIVGLLGVPATGVTVVCWLPSVPAT